ncbi:hypothetical protein OA2633_12305 [Oceanicaulis alexandrii HTCC2633]|uniref:DUF4175 domain-containing protein n=1 Tax=Oceanicaulis sp. HTCC2633 TaxID=314254 RepID=UPI0000668AD3|nr:DUF4175 family protein [Oceanicaulis sp. HTCC2633]EAP90484.1 hypothetical protein OA2633_12305 [Oceanicaulis alexandrii HTCC2633] [Oceanicaulis sp. HTCC2633]
MQRSHAFLRARIALLWERAAPVLIGPAALLGAYLALALFGAFERLGDPWRLIALAMTLGAAAAWIRWKLPLFTVPDRTEIERRVEDDSGLKDRPFEALRDAPASGDPQLWSAHIERMKARLATARARRPRAAWGRLDPYGLRVSFVIVLLTGGFLAGDLAGPRLGDAFAPRLLAGGGQDARVDLWVEAPDYTGRPALFLRDRRTAEIPEGSTLFARIAGLNRAPSISGAPFETETLSEGVQLARITPQSDGVISLRAGRLRESVDFTLIEDTPPHLTFAAEPEGDAQGRLKLEFVAEDDYGLKTIWLEYARAPADESQPAAVFQSQEITPGQIRPSEGGLDLAEIDLSRSPLAGERVVIRLAGVDGAGQRGQSGEMTITLPQRVFLDPLARSVASERRRFLQVDDSYAAMPDGPPRERPYLDDQPQRRLERAPDEIRRLAMALNAVSDAPSSYFDDAIVWMGLRTALMEVRRARELDELDHMEGDLWDIALRAELGSLADAEAALAAAERALADALARGADQIEISALMDAFEQAMDRYMQLLMREAAEAGRFAEGGGGGNMSADMLEQLLEALREATELGDTEGSRQALAMLAELLRNMQVTLGQGNGDGEGESAAAQAMREALEELSDAINEQRGLMEDTFNAQREQQEGQQGPSGRDPLSDPLAPGEPERGGSTDDSLEGPQSFERQDGASGRGLQELAEPQENLPGGLGDIEDAMPGSEAGEDARQALQDARRAMEDAARALREGDGEDALARQDEALAGLRSAAQSAAEALEQELNQGEEGEGNDPLGRGAAEGQDTQLPSESERQRARDILEELRRRAAERGRPQEELDYIDRLLERF